MHRYRWSPWKRTAGKIAVSIHHRVVRSVQAKIWRGVQPTGRRSIHGRRTAHHGPVTWCSLASATRKSETTWHLTRNRWKDKSCASHESVNRPPSRFSLSFSFPLPSLPFLSLYRCTRTTGTAFVVPISQWATEKSAEIIATVISYRLYYKNVKWLDYEFKGKFPIYPWWWN